MSNIIDKAEGPFRDELRKWLEANLTDRFRAAANVDSLTDESHYEVRFEWERRLSDAGWLGISWPTEYGGRAGTELQELIFLLEHARAGGPPWVSVQGRDLFAPILLTHGTVEQKKRFLPAIQASEEMWGQGYSEPDAGSDLASVKTRAERDGDDWVINGQKIWTSFGERANWIYALCRTDPDAAKHKGLSLLLIPVDQPGVEVRPIRHMAGANDFCEVFFDDARTQAELVVGGVGSGWQVALGSLNVERFTSPLAYQSRFPFQWNDLIEELRRRSDTSRPLVRQRLAQAWIGLQINQWSNDRILESLVQRGTVGEESSLAKLRWATWHQRFSTLAVDLLGPSGLAATGRDETGDFQSIFLNARAETIYGGTNQVQRNIIGERMLGLPREPH